MDDETRNPFPGRSNAEIWKAHLEWKRPRVRICVEGFDTSLPADDIKKALINHFNSCGNVLRVIFKDRCALVTIAGEDAEEKALELNGSDVGGWNVSVKVSPVVLPPVMTPQQYDALIAAYNDPRRMYCIYVKGYDTSVPDDDLKIALRKHFASCGEITHVYIPRTCYGDLPRDRCAYVYFAGEEALDRALKLGKRFETGSELLVRALPIRNSGSCSGGVGYTIPPHCIEMANERGAMRRTTTH